jgi:hypothetical protein
MRLDYVALTVSARKRQKASMPMPFERSPPAWGEHLKVSSCAYADMDPDQDGFIIRGDWAAPGAVHIDGHYSLQISVSSQSRT